MRARASETYAVGRPADSFELEVGRELSSWTGVEFVPAVVVGPICVPWAVSLVDLAAHLRGHPLGAAGDYRGAVELEEEDEEEREESESGEPGSDASSLGSAFPRGRRRSRRGTGVARGREDAAAAAEVRVEMEEELRPDPEGPGQGLSHRTHILVELLREGDLLHASPALRGQRQRSKRHLLSAQRYAEISLLRLQGWRVCCISEHLWKRQGPDDDEEEVAAENKRLFFGLVARLGDQA